jgi:hypothetical protein
MRVVGAAVGLGNHLAAMVAPGVGAVVALEV